MQLALDVRPRRVVGRHLAFSRFVGVSEGAFEPDSVAFIFCDEEPCRDSSPEVGHAVWANVGATVERRWDSGLVLTGSLGASKLEHAGEVTCADGYGCDALGQQILVFIDGGVGSAFCMGVDLP